MILVFIAMMTPGASTQASMCYGSEHYTPKEIHTYAIPLSVIAVVLFTLVGYPLAKILVG
jgi:di/tricarboxylate transporter